MTISPRGNLTSHFYRKLYVFSIKSAGCVYGKSRFLTLFYILWYIGPLAHYLIFLEEPTILTWRDGSIRAIRSLPTPLFRPKLPFHFFVFWVSGQRGSVFWASGEGGGPFSGFQGRDGGPFSGFQGRPSSHVWGGGMHWPGLGECTEAQRTTSSSKKPSKNPLGKPS